MSVFIEAALKVSLVLAAALLAMPLLRRQSAALRHFVLSLALASCALVPFADAALPSWRIPVPVAPRILPDARVANTRAAPAAPPVAWKAEAAATPQRRRVDAAAVAVKIWIGGLITALAVLGVGLLRLRRLAGRATRVYQGPWFEEAARVSRELDLRPPVLLQTSEPHLPVVWGVVQPRVLVPASAREWPLDRIRVVLHHELAHIQRGDWAVQCAGELLRAVHWFNPLMWKVCSRMRQECEQACDDEVIRRGVDAPEYAAHLVDIARDLRQRRAWLPAPAIAQSSGFERRIQAMLDVHLNRHPLSRLARVAALAGCLSVTIPIAGLAAQAALVTFGGSVLDPLNAVLPDTAVTLTNVDTQAQFQVRSDRQGRYEIPGVPPGRYVLETALPGFAPLKFELSVGGSNVERDLRLALGELQETVTVSPNDSGEPAAPMSAERKARLEELLRKRAAQTCPGNQTTSGPAIGGNIRVPIKTRSVAPVYPAHLASSGGAGTVRMAAIIGTNGAIREINVLSAAHPDFADAAVEAVRQWEFDATLLNCVAMEVKMMVTVNFVQKGQ
jgi:TonB family protein